VTKEAKFVDSVGHPMTKMLSTSGGLRPPLDQGLSPWTSLGALPPDPRYRLVLRTRHGAPNHLTPSAAYVERHSERVLVLKMDLVDCLLNVFTANAPHSGKSDAIKYVL